MTRWRPLQRIKRWWRVRVAKSDLSPLREFVYLDEVSVYSLLASRQGALASEYTDTTVSSYRGELSSGGGVSGAIIKAETKSKFEAGLSQTSQILRKSTIQSAFKELYEGERDKLAARVIASPHDDVPKVNKWEAIFESGGNAKFKSWIISASSLRRGQLIEFDVELEADPTFRISSIASTMTELVKGSRELFPPTAVRQLEEVETVNRVLELLMVGLVPLRCRLAEYELVERSGVQLLVHHRLLDQLPSTDSVNRLPAHLVGVTEQRLFWKDIRRVLFARSRFKILARLNNDGVRFEWTAVKLVDVLKDLLPDLGQQIDNFGRQALTLRSAASESETAKIVRMTAALVVYASGLLQREGGRLDDVAAAECALIAHEHSTMHASYTDRRRACMAIEEFVARTLSRNVDSLSSAVDLRDQVMSGAGLVEEGSSKVERSMASGGHPPIREALLDSEIAAIYW